MTNFTLQDGWWQIEAFIPLFGRSLPIHIVQEDNGSPTPRQLEVFDSLQSLPPILLQEIATAAEQYYQSTADIIDLTHTGINPSHLEQYYQFSSIHIPELRYCDANYFFIWGSCDWEPEHGMEIIVENNRVFYCGDYLGIAGGVWWERIITAPPDRRHEIWDEFLA